MKQVILIHGLPDKEEVLGDVWPSPSNAHWFPWVQKQLTPQDIFCQTIKMPRSYDPIYKDHERVLSQMAITNETILVGHSCGGAFLLRYLSEHNDLKPKKVILVAPWLDPENYLKELFNETRNSIKSQVIKSQGKEFAFTRIMKCGVCGSGITAYEKFKKLLNGGVNRHVYYRCTKSKYRNCKNQSINEQDLIKEFQNMVESLEFKTVKISEKLKQEIERFKKLQNLFLGTEN